MNLSAEKQGGQNSPFIQKDTRTVGAGEGIKSSDIKA